MNSSHSNSSNGDAEKIHQAYEIIANTGQVAGSKTWSDTIVESSGGGGYVGKYGGYVAAPKISSTVKVRTVFYLILENGQEIEIDSSGWDFNPRDGQIVTAFFYADLEEKDLFEGQKGGFVNFLLDTANFISKMSGQSLNREYTKLYYLYNHNSSVARISNEIANLNKTPLSPTLLSAILTAFIVFIPFCVSTFNPVLGFPITAWIGYKSFTAILPSCVKKQQISKQKYQYLVDSAESYLENAN